MKKTLLALVLAAGLTSFAGSAKAALTYNFSFNGNNDSPGSVAGVLTLNDAETAATSVFVTSSDQPNYNWVNMNNLIPYNSFSVDIGQIVAARFLSLSNDGFLELNYFNSNGYKKGSQKVVNFDGLNGIIFTPATSGGDTAAVPEPSQVAASLLLIGGIAGFVVVRRRRNGCVATTGSAKALAA